MDFSSLDLLASTALRDNNPSNSDNSSSPTEAHHPHHNHHDSVETEENDDDDEADGDGERVKETNTASESDCPQEEMGSVKCGKQHKRNGKTMSILVRDGKCVAKKLARDPVCDKQKEDQDTGDCNVTLSPQSSSVQERDVCTNDNAASAQSAVPSKCPKQMKETEVKHKPEKSSHLCNGLNTSNHQISLTTTCEGSNAVTLTYVAGAAVSCSSGTAEASSDSRVQPNAETSAEASEGSAENGAVKSDRDCDAGDGLLTAASCDTLQTVDSADSVCQDQAAASELHEPVRENSGCCDSVPDREEESTVSAGQAGTDTQPSQDLPSSLHDNKAQDEADSTRSQCVNFTVTELHGRPITSLSETETSVESKTAGVCDDVFDLFYVPTTSEPAAEVVREQDRSRRNSLDQDKGSSGNKQLDPSTSKDSQVESILSPPPPPPLLPVALTALVNLDHSYCSFPRGVVPENDDSGESADENVSADEIERRPRSLSVDSVYLQYGVSGLPNQQENLSQNDKLALLSPTLSVESVSNDSSLSEHSTAAGGQCYSILTGGPSMARTSRPTLASVDSQGGADSPADGASRLQSNMLEAGANSSLLDTNSLALGPNVAKFRIGNLGSFSNSHLEVEERSKKNKLKIGLSSDPVMKTSLSSPAIASPASPFPLLQSPGMEWDRSDAGSECPDDLNSSSTEDKFLSSSHDSEAFGTTSQVWRHPVFHDHDYCCKEVSEEYLGKPVAPTPPTKPGKRKYVKRKDRQEEEEKLRKGKYLKRELLKQDNRFNLGANRGVDNRTLAARSSLLTENLTTKPNPVGRPRKRTEKQLEEYDAETGTKMKITGKYQDQYVYYLNKSSRNRRRKVDEKVPPVDKIILPAPKPGDIVVPHLSDADCEAIRRGGRMALQNNNNYSASGNSQPMPPHADHSDMDSSIVNTILSMETEHGNLPSPLESYDGEGHNDEFVDFEGNLTQEQLSMLVDCLNDYPMEETTTSQALDLFTSTETVPVPSTTVDSLAATTVEEDFMVPREESTTSHISGSSDSVALLPKVEAKSPSELKQVSNSLDYCNYTAAVTSTLPTSQPSVEKNLEFLKTPFTSSDSQGLFPTVSPVTSSGSQGLFVPPPPMSLTTPAADIRSDDVNETPWIVTVTLYDNDIPAIIINNMPHVRLVDIHRQILPAKDTGILKKRCQLMNIQVSNCTEMQRYFLVQYGRAHNSKSTLVISKDEAQRLITYYAHPPPRNLRGEEGAGLRRASSYAELRSIMERPSNPGRNSGLPFTQSRKRGGFRRRAVPTRSQGPSPEPVAQSAVSPVMEPMLSSPLPAEPAISVKGLRHKKINFREMLKGEDSSPQTSPLLEDIIDPDSTAVLEEGSVTKGRGSKTGVSAGRTKRRVSKEPGSGPPSKRGRKAWRKKEESSPHAVLNLVEADIVVCNDSPNSAVVNSKNKKRSPGSSVSGSLGSGRSPKSKFGFKVNVKSLVSSGVSLSADGSQPRKKNLFGRKSSSSTDVTVEVADDAVPRSHPLRVLRISHQDVEALPPPTPQIVSPMAEVHLDLYKRASSPCVKCDTCHKFLSVPGFLKHQHVNGEAENQDNGSHVDVVHSHRRRMLVPMNKENISLDEQRLWNEFVALQESLDHSVGVASMGAYPLTPLSPASPVGSSLHSFGAVVSPALEESLLTMTPESPHPAHVGLNHLHNGSLLDSETIPNSQGVSVMDERCVTSPDNETCSGSDAVNVGMSFPSEAAAHPWETPLSLCSPPSLSPATTHTYNEEKYVVNNVESNDKEIPSLPKTVVPSSKRQCPSYQRPRKVSPATNIRTSSRKRETKRLYSFEKYEYGGGGKKGGRGDADVHDFEDDFPGTLLDDVNGTVRSDTLLHLSPDNALHEPQNA